MPQARLRADNSQLLFDRLEFLRQHRNYHTEQCTRLPNRGWEVLFSERDLRSVLEEHLKSINDQVVRIQGPRFDSESDEMLAAAVASELLIEPLQLLEDEISVSSRDAKINVSHDFRRAVIDPSQPTYVDGLKVTYHLPFTGRRELLKCRPGTYTLNPPKAVIGREELQFPYEQPDREVGATKPLFAADLARLKEWLPWVNQQLAEYHSSLEYEVKQRIATRRGHLKRTELDLGSLGYRVRSATETSTGFAIAASSNDVNKRRKTTVRDKARTIYDVALSFAGEDREYVEKVAEQLREFGMRVFYDRFEQVDLWGKDLAEHLGHVYGKDSRFVVLFVSRAYAAKAWPNHEKQFALARQLEGEKRRILPVRFDNTEVPGVSSSIGYLDLRVLTPEKLAELIRQKVDAEDGDD